MDQYATGQAVRQFNGPGALTPTAICDESASRIRDGICMTEQTLSELDEALNQLERRLDTVLTPVPPSTTGQAQAKNQQIGSHVKGRVDILNEGFSLAVQRIRHLMSRVEV